MPSLFDGDNLDLAVPESELLRTIMMIIEGYSVIGGETFLKSCHASIGVVFSRFLTEMEEVKMVPIIMR